MYFCVFTDWAVVFSLDKLGDPLIFSHENDMGGIQPIRGHEADFSANRGVQ